MRAYIFISLGHVDFKQRSLVVHCLVVGGRGGGVQSLQGVVTTEQEGIPERDESGLPTPVLAAKRRTILMVVIPFAEPFLFYLHVQFT